MDDKMPWILFSYRTLSETSTLRVRAWRILKRIGALSLQNSVCIVPKTALTVRKLNQLKTLVEESGGEALSLDVAMFLPDSVRLLVQRFNEERSKDYGELVKQCKEFSFTNRVSESESELLRLEKSLRKTVARDYFDCPDKETAESEILKLRKQFDEWTEVGRKSP